MSKVTGRSLNRRRALTLLGSGAAAVSTLGLAGCGGDEEAPRPELIEAEPDGAPTKPPKQSEAPSRDATDATDSAMAEGNSSSAGAEAEDAAPDNIASDGGMQKVDESSTKAKQLAYVHDASTVSADAQPRYEEGQQCGNCALYQGGNAEWGACPLFSGQQVKRTGWCNAYAPRGA